MKIVVSDVKNEIHTCTCTHISPLFIVSFSSTHSTIQDIPGTSQEHSTVQKALSQVGNFIIGASGSVKQMLCGSSIAALTILAVNKIEKG